MSNQSFLLWTWISFLQYYTYNRNRFILDEAQAIWALGKAQEVWEYLQKTTGMGYDGEEEDVIRKIAQMEEIDEERYGAMLASD